MLTKDQAISARHFAHVSLKDSRGDPVQCRANGACKVWKTRPNDFKLPVKHGLFNCFYITQDNANEWTVL